MNEVKATVGQDQDQGGVEENSAISINKNGKPISEEFASASDEAARLAEAQADRLRAREALGARSVVNSKEALAAASGPAEPKAVAKLVITGYDNGNCVVEGPLGEPNKYIDLCAAALKVLVGHTCAHYQEQLAKKKVPFMQRVFGRKS